MLPVAQRELVERKKWLTTDEFVEMLAISQVLPGPNVVNLALMFGDRAFGWRGALAALGRHVDRADGHRAGTDRALRPLRAVPDGHRRVAGMGAIAAGLVLSTGIKLFGTLGRNVTVLTQAQFDAFALGLPWQRLEQMKAISRM